MDNLLILARCEVCFWLNNHAEIPYVAIDTRDDAIWVTLGTQTTHVIVVIRGSDITSDQHAVWEKLDGALRSFLAPQ